MHDACALLTLSRTLAATTIPSPGGVPGRVSVRLSMPTRTRVLMMTVIILETPEFSTWWLEFGSFFVQ